MSKVTAARFDLQIHNSKYNSRTHLRFEQPKRKFYVENDTFRKIAADLFAKIIKEVTMKNAVLNCYRKFER